MPTSETIERPAWWGLFVGSLREVSADRIVLGSEMTLFLRPGDTCPYAPGIHVEVKYQRRGPRLEVGQHRGDGLAKEESHERLARIRGSRCPPGSLPRCSSANCHWGGNLGLPPSAHTRARARE